MTHNSLSQRFNADSHCSKGIRMDRFLWFSKGCLDRSELHAFREHTLGCPRNDRSFNCSLLAHESRDTSREVVRLKPKVLKFVFFPRRACAPYFKRAKASVIGSNPVEVASKLLTRRPFHPSSQGEGERCTSEGRMASIGFEGTSQAVNLERFLCGVKMQISSIRPTVWKPVVGFDGSLSIYVRANQAEFGHARAGESTRAIQLNRGLI